jgi:FMN phosphatase YigB (HAD superfamily)
MQTICLVDIDGTLVENRFSFKAMRDLLEDVLPHTNKTLQEIAPELWRENTHRQQSDPDNVLTMDWHDIVATVAQRYGVMLERSLDDLWRHYASADDVTINDDAPSVMETLREGGRKLVIATKGLSKYQYPLLDVTNLRDYFDEVLAPDITGYLKTTPAYFSEFLARQMQDYGEETCYIQIGDHYLDDVICPVQNGFYSIMRAPIEVLRDLDPFERPAYLHLHRKDISTYPNEAPYDVQPFPVRPHAVVYSLQEVPAVVERIERAHAMTMDSADA